jgi:hypothetical protein
VKSLVYEEKTNNQDALLHRVLDAAELIRNTPDVLEHTINLLPQRTTQCISVDGAQFENLL